MLLKNKFKRSVKGGICVEMSIQCAPQDYDVYLEGIVLKTSMSVPGKMANTFGATTPQDIAKATVLALSRAVPPAVPGVAFLSGGQTEEQVRTV